MSRSSAAIASLPHAPSLVDATGMSRRKPLLRASSFMSVDLQSRFLDHLAPARAIRLDESGQLLGRRRERIDALHAQLLLDVGLRLHAADLRRDLVDDILRR